MGTANINMDYLKPIHSFLAWFDDLLGITNKDKEVADIKQSAITKVDETTKVMEQVGNLQRLVMKKTTTYYLGKAAGVIK